ncbi:trehalose-phosphatase [Salinicola peritrichatus]|uniref:trehalose-phosphatase n=1 Tax=Salinicola peritrichatus TaxID=1267424 RepID=UPI0013A627F8|nr:trehalose-phosphatase [Salinicola peritrichatus]
MLTLRLSDNNTSFDEGKLIEACVFDLDGVVTRTQKLHCQAWKSIFDDYLKSRTARHNKSFIPFDAEKDYWLHVDGRSPVEGVKRFLTSRSMILPEGNENDSVEQETVQGLANKKDELFRMLLERDGVEVIETTVVFIRSIRAAGLKSALVSSSRNARQVLDKAGLTGLFDVCIDGVEAEVQRLHGKPSPDVYRYAAKKLNLEPIRLLTIEGTLSGIESAKSAGYGLIVAIGGDGKRSVLIQHGADMVITDLMELHRSDLFRQSGVNQYFSIIVRRLENKAPAIFLDYDGALRPMIARPEMALLDITMRETLDRLSKKVFIGIISSRDLYDVADLMGSDNLVYTGSHGLDIAEPNGIRMECPEAIEHLPILDWAERRLRRQLATVEGVIVERKRFSIAVHYRLVSSENVNAIDNLVARVIEMALPALRRTGGKKTFEIRPAVEWDKGKALLWLLKTLDVNSSRLLPFCIGGDEADEDAFDVSQGKNGIGVIVFSVSSLTTACFRLNDVADVKTVLDRLANY